MGVRNVLYYYDVAVDLDIDWSAVERDLPVLKHQIQTILKGTSAES